MVDALFIDPRGPYPKLLGPEHCWDEQRDARTYRGCGPVVAHPPCQRWTNLAAANYTRYHKVRPAWYFGGSDEGCFRAALDALLMNGGVLEHPAHTHAFKAYGLPKPRPENPSWTRHEYCGTHIWVCQVCQSCYGHKAQKKTWLVYYSPAGVKPFDLNWHQRPGTHQVGWTDQRGKARNKPTLSKREANETPILFARELIRLAEWSRGECLFCGEPAHTHSCGSGPFA